MDDDLQQFSRRDGVLYCEDVPLTKVVQEYGTPTYAYSLGAILGQYRNFVQAVAALRPIVCFAVKANANLSILRALAEEGAGFDIVSGGELARVLRVAPDASRSVFSGVGKTHDEIEKA